MEENKEEKKSKFVEMIESNAQKVLVEKYGLPSNIRVRYYNPLSNSIKKIEETKEEDSK